MLDKIISFIESETCEMIQVTLGYLALAYLIIGAALQIFFRVGY